MGDLMRTFNMQSGTGKQIKVVITSDGWHQYAEGAAQAADATDQLSEESQKLTDGTGKLTAENSRLTSSYSKLKYVIGGLGLGLILRQITSISDTYTSLNNRLKLVTESEEELHIIEEKLYFASQETRVSYESTANLYARVARNAKELKLNQAELLSITELTNKSIQIGGATSQEAAAGVIQFSQAMASGVLRGDELRSVLENMPRLAEALSKGLGVTIGELRKMGEQGELTAEKVVQALLSQKHVIDSEFKELAPTIGGVMETISNSIRKAISDADMSQLTDELTEFREELEKPATSEAITAFSAAMITGLTQIVQLFSGAVNLAERYGEAWGKLVAGSGGKFFNLSQQELLALEDRLVTQSNQNVLEGGRKMSLRAQEQLQRDLEQVRTLLSLYVDATQQLKAATDDGVGGSSGRDFSEAEKKGHEIIFNLLKEKELHGEVGNAAKARFEIEFGKLRDLLPHHKELVLQLAEELDVMDAQVDKEKDLAKENQKRLREQAKLVEENKKAHEQLIEMIDKEQEASVKNMTEKLAALKKSLMSETELVRQRYEAEVAFLEDARARMYVTEEEYQQLRLDLELKADLEIGQIHERALKQAGISTRDNFKEIADAIRGYGDDTTNAIVDMFMGLEVNMHNIVNSIIRDLMRIQIQNNLVNPLLDLGTSFLGSLFGGGSSVAGELGAIDPGLFSEILHRGGIAGRGTGGRKMPASLFENAPRFHDGRMPGLAPYEIPAILRRDEGVFTPEQMRALGGPAKVNVTVINNTGSDVQVNDRGMVNGEQQIEIIVDQALKKMQRSGKLDSTMKQYGTTRQPVQR